MCNGAECPPQVHSAPMASPRIIPGRSPRNAGRVAPYLGLLALRERLGPYPFVLTKVLRELTKLRISQGGRQIRIILAIFHRDRAIKLGAWRINFEVPQGVRFPCIPADD